MQRKPGEGFEYNNCDYLLLGAILERLSGESMRRAYERRIFQPLAMSRTFLATRHRPEPSEALRGSRDDGTPELPQPLPVHGASGAVGSTLDDLLRFDRALRRHELLPKSATELMFRGEEPYFQALGSWAYPLALASRNRPLAIVERQGSIGGLRLLNVLSFEGEGSDDDLIVILVATTSATELFQLYAGRGLPFDILTLVAGTP